MTVSLTAIIVEATRNTTFALPVMLVLMLTKWVADFFNESLYDAHIELTETPMLGWNPPELSRNIQAEFDAYLNKLYLSAEEESCWIDFRPYMHKNPNRVPLSASLQSIFSLFRGLGLRFLIVCDLHNRVSFIHLLCMLFTVGYYCCHLLLLCII
ncbi:unnamed protein product [Anisakis simplex]|uniref:H(+)/Cl(-) exchange transporter 7 (inferred by orthology to a human protein) n=1 Tax=Anisakis simplex TaxID=6269 RepID=A0A0M3K6N0_ANISI|nr:unnamed protein product [Anisakis simplex]